MGIKYSFVDSELYGTDDINDIARCLTGAGVMPFLSKDSYSTSDLNSIAEALVSSGTSLDGCKCTVENAGTADMQVKISQGIIFFEGGVRLIVDSEGYSIAISPNTSGYVFAHYSPSLQIADIKFATKLPTDGEYVELARLWADGAITGARSFARSKVGTMGRNVMFNSAFTKVTPVEPAEKPFSNWKYSIITAKLQGIDVSKFNYAHITSTNGYDMGLFDINQNMILYAIEGNDYIKRDLSDQRICTYINYELFGGIKIIDGELCLMLMSDSTRYFKEPYLSQTFCVTLA